MSDKNEMEPDMEIIESPLKEKPKRGRPRKINDVRKSCVNQKQTAEFESNAEKMKKMRKSQSTKIYSCNTCHMVYKVRQKMKK